MKYISENNLSETNEEEGKPQVKRGRPKGSKKDRKLLADEQAADRELVSTACPGIGFDVRRQLVTFKDGKDTAVLSPGELKNLHHVIGMKLGQSVPKDRAQSAAEILIAMNRIDPVVGYLNSLRGKASKLSWKEIATKVFGPVSDFEVTIFKKWMTGAVARPLNPGCAMDWLMVLVGPQGVGKSAFGRALTPNSNWFGELVSDPDILLKEPQRMAMSWLNELPEVDSFTCGRKADREKMKNLISVREDLTRVPYAAYPERIPRSFVFYGNTNRSEFIEDTESRRTFMVRIPEGHTIDFKWVEENRDAIWGKALEEYENGTQYIWSRAEYEEAHSAIMQYRLEDPIEEILDEFLKTRNRVTTSDVIRCVLQVPSHLQDKSHSKRVSELMEARGWIKYSTTIDKKSVRAFKRPPYTAMVNENSDY